MAQLAEVKKATRVESIADLWFDLLVVLNPLSPYLNSNCSNLENLAIECSCLGNHQHTIHLIRNHTDEKHVLTFEKINPAQWQTLVKILDRYTEFKEEKFSKWKGWSVLFTKTKQELETW